MAPDISITFDHHNSNQISSVTIFGLEITDISLSRRMRIKCRPCPKNVGSMPLGIFRNDLLYACHLTPFIKRTLGQRQSQFYQGKQRTLKHSCVITPLRAGLVQWVVLRSPFQHFDVKIWVPSEIIMVHRWPWRRSHRFLKYCLSPASKVSRGL